MNYDKYFKEGIEEHIKLSEFNSNNTKRLTIEETKEKLLTLKYITDELESWRRS